MAVLGHGHGDSSTMSTEEENLMSTLDLVEALQAKRANRRSTVNRLHSSTGNLSLGLMSDTSGSGVTPGKNAQWNCAPRRPQFSSQRRQLSPQRPTVGRVRSSSNLLSGRSRSSRDLVQLKGSKNQSKNQKVNLTAMLDDLKNKPSNGVDDGDNNDAENHSLSSNSFASRQSGFHPHDSITPDKMGQLSELDLSAMEQPAATTLENDESPLSPQSFHGFLQNKQRSRPQRSHSFDCGSSHNHSTSRIPWSPETPWKTFAKNVRYLGRQTTFGRNLTYLASPNPQTTFGRNISTLAGWILGSNPEESQSDSPTTNTHRHFPQEHELATYLHNVTDQSRHLASRNSTRTSTEPFQRPYNPKTQG
jgi:hypothetical protein